MNKEQQRVAIAEACGFVTRYKGTPSETTVRVTLPDYLSDLNAMHEAEQVLNHTDRYQFGKALCSLLKINTDGGLDVVDIYYACHATAAQRAEAFLKTIGKWAE